MNDQDLFIQALSNLPNRGGTNEALRKQLDWDNERYWGVRDALVIDQKVEKRRGRGGSTFLIIPDSGAMEPQVAPISEVNSPPESTSETSYYPKVKGVIENDWIKDLSFDFQQSIVEITATQGRRSTGGTWTRPDLTLWGLRTFKYLPNKYVDIITFEVKAEGNVDVQSVYEALAHRRAATMSYVWLHVPSSREEQLQPAVRLVSAEAAAHGIGLIVARSPDTYDTWDTVLDATRVEPAPEALNEFTHQQMPRQDSENEYFQHHYIL